MAKELLVQKRVHEAYWKHDWNCATVTVLTLGDLFDLEVGSQVIDAALGMHGAGGYRAQCGLVEGGLMFIGLLGRARGLPDDATTQVCRDFAAAFEARFGSLLCRELRPEGFAPDNPPHLCEDLTCQAILFDVDCISQSLRTSE